MSRAIVTDGIACRQSEEVTDPTVDLCPGLYFAADAASGLLVLELFYVFRLVYYGRTYDNSDKYYQVPLGNVWFLCYDR